MKKTLASTSLFAVFGIVAAAPIENVTNRNDSGPGSLRAAIANVDWGGTVNVLVTGTIPVSATLQANRPMTIAAVNGPVTLDAQNRARVMFASNALTLRNISFFRGRANQHGAGLWVRGPLTMTGGGAVDCFAKASDIFENTGGAIRVEGNANLSGVTLDANGVINGHENGYLRGGALFVRGNLVLNNSNMTGNQVAAGSFVGSGTPTSCEGGAIYVDGNLSGSNNRINRNSAFAANTNGFSGGSSEGGGIYVRGSVDVSNLTMEQNQAIGGNGASFSGAVAGGALYYRSRSTIRNSSFSNNRIQTSRKSALGGGVYAGDYSTITWSNFGGNLASGETASGGGFYCYSGSNIRNSVFGVNRAVASNGAAFGGGVYAFHSGTYDHNTFHGNQASGNQNSLGGGIHSFHVSSFQWCDFRWNGSSGEGGGLYTWQGYNTNGSLINENSARQFPNLRWRGGGF
jgi:autotransporter family porin